jgi:hypothetical protein
MVKVMVCYYMKVLTAFIFVVSVSVLLDPIEQLPSKVLLRFLCTLIDIYVWEIVLHLMQCVPFNKMRGHVSKSLHRISLFICLGSRLVRDVVTACSNDLVHVGCFFFRHFSWSDW